MSLSSLLRLKLVIETLTKSFLLTERIDLTIIFTNMYQITYVGLNLSLILQ